MSVSRTSACVSRLALSTIVAFLACPAIPAAPSQQATITLPGSVPIVLVYVPPGSFVMGAPETERSRHVDEGPTHDVNVPGFYLGQCEVTQRQWLALMGAWPDSTRFPNADMGLGDDYPAYYISWDDAQSFITALNNHMTQTAQGPATFRLPSEAEWEYACRAHTTTRFFFGDSLSVDDMAADGPAGTMPGNRTDYMWYSANMGTSGSPDYGVKPVGTKAPNQFDLYDMSGNVLEWCQDWYHDDYTGAPADGSAWESPVGIGRVLRAGDWTAPATYCRSAHRDWNAPSTRLFLIGFRLAWTSPPIPHPTGTGRSWPLYE